MRGRVTIASFWGEKGDWPYVRQPKAWDDIANQHDTTFEIVKFPSSPIMAIRISNSGGIGSTVLSWVTNALLRARLGDNVSVTAAFKPMPYELDIGSVTRDLEDLERQFGYTVDVLLPLGTSVAVPLLVSTVVTEKEHRLRALMLMEGLDTRWYWLCEWLWNSTIMLITALLVVFMGADLTFVARSPDVFFVLMLIWSQVVVMLSMLLSVLYNRVVLAYLVNATLVTLLVLLSLLINQEMLDPFERLPAPLFLVAPIGYYRGIHLLFKRTYSFDYFHGEMADVFNYLIIDIFLYFFLALYLDAVMPRQYGVVRHPLFFLEPCGRAVRRLLGNNGVERVAAAESTNEDEDVRAERTMIDESSAGDDNISIRTAHLRKVYSAEKVAVDDLCLSIRRGECFGLLGPNGAGKTVRAPSRVWPPA